MPTKRNRAGNQQNYIEAGHGDASGEYGDNATGSNKHFTVFKKPDGEEKTTNEPNIAVTPNNDKTVETTKNFEEYVDKNFKEEFGQGLKASFNAGNDYQKDKLGYFTSNGIIKINETKGNSYYDGSVTLNQRQISQKKGSFSKEVGDTLYHEFGHAYDEFFAKGIVDKDGKTIVEKMITEEDNEKLHQNNKSFVDALMLSGNLSTNKYLSNGKTLYETLKDECHKMVRGKVWDTIIKEYKETAKQEVLKKFPDYYSNKEKASKLRADIEQEARDKFPYKWNVSASEFNANEKAKRDYIEKRYEETGFNQLWQKSRENDFDVSRIENETLKKYSNLSDMYGIYKKIPYGFGSGHAGSYGKNKGALAHEFFAEFNSTTARNDDFAKAQMELYEKYMPESTKMAKELFDLMDKAWKGAKR